MSWQATAWAEKQKTGSPARKVLLLVLANYANEEGYCWPSQATLCKGTEQSPDTVQRQLKRLAIDGLITILRKPRTSGRWPSLAYRLHMFAEPQPAARSNPAGAVDNSDSLRHGHAATSTDHHAATSTATMPQALRHEPSKKNIQREPSYEPSAPIRGALRAAISSKRSGEKSVQHVQNRIVDRLGQGDVAAGWLLFGALDGSDRKYLETCERDDAWTDSTVEDYRAVAQRRLEPQLCR